VTRSTHDPLSNRCTRCGYTFRQCGSASTCDGNLRRTEDARLRIERERLERELRRASARARRARTGGR
jgi:hypothetical protein